MLSLSLQCLLCKDKLARLDANKMQAPCLLHAAIAADECLRDSCMRAESQSDRQSQCVYLIAYAFCCISGTDLPQSSVPWRLLHCMHAVGIQAENEVVKQVQAEKDRLLAQLRAQMADMQRQHDQMAAELQRKLAWCAASLFVSCENKGSLLTVCQKTCMTYTSSKDCHFRLRPSQTQTDEHGHGHHLHDVQHNSLYPACQ